jgi:hypothetical protein
MKTKLLIVFAAICILTTQAHGSFATQNFGARGFEATGTRTLDEINTTPLAHGFVSGVKCEKTDFYGQSKTEKKKIIEECIHQGLSRESIVSNGCAAKHPLRKINALSSSEIVSKYGAACSDEVSFYKAYQWRKWEEHTEAVTNFSKEKTVLFAGIAQKTQGGEPATSFSLVRYNWDIGGGDEIPFYLIANDESKETAKAVAASAADTNAGILNIKFTGTGMLTGNRGDNFTDYSHSRKGGVYYSFEGGMKLDRKLGGSELDFHPSGYIGALIQMEQPIYAEADYSSKAGTVSLGLMAYGMYNDAGEVKRYLTAAGLIQTEVDKMEDVAGVISGWFSFNVTNEFNVSYRKVYTSTNELFKDSETFTVDYQALSF